jgi:hypothetical protein
VVGGGGMVHKTSGRLKNIVEDLDWGEREKERKRYIFIYFEVVDRGGVAGDEFVVCLI